MKRIFDLVVSVILVILLSPIMLIIALLVRIKMGSPILFIQERSGLDAQPFSLYKFRTMSNTKNKQGQLLPGHLRLNKLGIFLRKYSLDELPQLFNVIKGDVSLVGPRPLLMEYLPLYNEQQAKRHLVRPGITGWAQVNGRNKITWEKKFEYDVWYVHNKSFFLDLKILLLTVKKVVYSEGIIHDEADFMGTMENEKHGT